MNGEWTKCRIEEVAERVAMGPFGSSIKVETFVPEGVPVISGQHLHGFRLDDTPGYNFITPEHAERLRNANVQRGDVVLTHRGTIGQIAYIPATSARDRYVVSQSQFYLRPDQSKVLPEFLVAYFRSPEGQHKLLANTSQVGVPSIAQPVTYLRSLEIPLPPLSEQRAIAHILGTLDDKIELLRRQNETLEAMARALFRAWFVDFEPVRAKREGRWRRGESLPGLPAHLYDLFPDRLVESELGEIPEGWEVGTLGHVADHPRRAIAPEGIEPDTPYIALEHMPRRCIALSDWGVADGLESNKFEFRRGEILFGKLRPYFHKVGVAPVGGVCSTDIVVLAPKSEVWFGFVLGHVSSAEFVEYTNAGSTGTKMPRTSWAEMARYTVALPPHAVASAFTKMLQPPIDGIIADIHESRTLAQLRDTLLPKLISGELRVKDAGAFFRERKP
ncbi:MAG: restriction endonuclease subunit S [Silanimonas lenta]